MHPAMWNDLQTHHQKNIRLLSHAATRHRQAAAVAPCRANAPRQRPWANVKRLYWFAAAQTYVRIPILCAAPPRSGHQRMQRRTRPCRAKASGRQLASYAGLGTQHLGNAGMPYRSNALPRPLRLCPHAPNCQWNRMSCLWNAAPKGRDDGS